jgi:hypothetical protein
MIGKFVLVRTVNAGVHVGTFVASESDEIVLSDAETVLENGRRVVQQEVRK